MYDVLICLYQLKQSKTMISDIKIDMQSFDELLTYDRKASKDLVVDLVSKYAPPKNLLDVTGKLAVSIRSSESQLQTWMQEYVESPGISNRHQELFKTLKKHSRARQAEAQRIMIK